MNKQQQLNKRIAVLDIHSPLYLRSAKNKKTAGCVADIYEIVDKASDAGFSAIQLLPIQDTGLLPSPYLGRSIFSYNPAHFSGVKEQDDINDVIDYRSVYKNRLDILKKAAEKIEIDLASFSRNEIAYALFTHFHSIYRSRWPKWPKTIRHGRVGEILARYPQLEEPVKQILAEQQLLSEEWNNLIDYSKKKNINFIMDKPIYPIHDSAEVWANQPLYYLNDDGTLKYASGCNNPRDPFGAQYWGHAVYQFKEKPDEVIDYFIEQIRFMSKISKFIRLDHTLALIWKYYLIDPGTKEGHHVRAIKHNLFNRLIEEFPEIYFIAEDLGYINNKAVDEQLEAHAIPGMRCLQWYHIPKYAYLKKYPKLCMAMTANHDLDSLPNWWGKLRSNRKAMFRRQMSEENSSEVNRLIELVFASNAQIASTTLRDIAGDLRRYNHPSSKNYYDWRLRSSIDIEKLTFEKVSRIIKNSNR